MNKNVTLIVFLLVLFSSNINGQTIKMSVEELNSKLLESKTSYYTDLSLLYLNYAKRPLNSSEATLLKTIEKLLSDRTYAKLIIESSRKYPIPELDYIISNMLFIPADKQDSTLYESLIKAAYSLRGAFIEDKILDCLSKMTQTQQSYMAGKVISDFWDILLKIDPQRYYSRYFGFYFSNPQGYVLLENDMVIQKRFFQNLRNICRSGGYKDYLKFFIKNRHLLINDKKRAIHQKAVSSIIQTIDGSTPLNYCLKTVLSLYSSGTISSEGKKQFVLKLQEEFWMFPNDILGDSLLFQRLGITNIQFNYVPQYLTEKEFKFAYKYCPQYFDTLSIQTNISASRDIARLYHNICDDYNLSQISSSFLLRNYPVANDVFSQNCIDRAFIEMKVKDALYKTCVFNGIDGSKSIGYSFVLLKKELDYQAIKLYDALQFQTRRSTPHNVSSVNNYGGSVNGSTTFLQRCHTKRFDDFLFMTIGDDSIYRMNNRTTQYYKFNTNRLSLLSRSIDLNTQTYIENFTCKDCSDTLSYYDKIPITYLSILSSDITSFDFNNYSFAIKNLDAKSSPYFRTITDPYDRIRLNSSLFVQIASSGIRAPKPPDLQEVMELYNFNLPDEDFPRWEDQIKQLRLNSGINNELIHRDPIPNFRDGLHIDTLPSYTYTKSDSVFNKFIADLSGVVNEGLTNFGYYRYIAQAVPEIERLPQDEDCETGNVLCYLKCCGYPHQNKMRLQAVNSINSLINTNNAFYKTNGIWSILSLHDCPSYNAQPQVTLYKSIISSKFDKALSIYKISLVNKSVSDPKCNQYRYSFALSNITISDNLRYLLQRDKYFFSDYSIDPSSLKENRARKLDEFAKCLVNELYSPYNSIYTLNCLGEIGGQLFDTCAFFYKSKKGFYLNEEANNLNQIHNYFHTDVLINADKIPPENLNNLLREDQYKFIISQVTSNVSQTKAEVDKYLNNFSIFVGIGSEGFSISIGNAGVSANFNGQLSPVVTNGGQMFKLPFQIDLISN